ncbi:MAG: hypothetical protein HZB33_12975 [Nitrospirae bacterium]|nr:hypothetical protein [Nitrospirota bacterium]
MIARYGSGDSYIEIEDDGRITAAGLGEFGPASLAFIPQTDPGPEEGTGGYEIWRHDGRQTLKEGDKPIQLVYAATNTKYLFVFRMSCNIDFYYLGHNHHAGAATYLFLFRVVKEPASDAEKWRIYDWIKDLKEQQ